MRKLFAVMNVRLIDMIIATFHTHLNLNLLVPDLLLDFGSLQLVRQLRLGFLWSERNKGSLSRYRIWDFLCEKERQKFIKVKYARNYFHSEQKKGFNRGSFVQENSRDVDSRS